MKRILVIISALALSTGVSYAMEEDAMDKDMMMEAPAPSVTVSGSGAMGFENVDDAEDTGIQLIREYKVAFSSSGTTDGGLMFGAGISIEDTHDDDPDKSVNGAKVFVGAADGSWKLQFGGNDPGIDLAGGIGVADDNFGGEDDETIALSGSIEGASYRITMADPGASGAADGDWSIGASYAINDISVGVGMDSESGLAIGVGTELAGLSTKLYYSKAEKQLANVEMELDPDNALEAYVGTGGMPAVMFTRQEQYFVNKANALQAWKTYVMSGADGVTNPFAVPEDDSDATAKALREANVALIDDLIAAGLEGNNHSLENEEEEDQTSILTTFIGTISDDADDVNTMLDNNAVSALTGFDTEPEQVARADLPLSSTLTEKDPAIPGNPAAANVLAGTTEYTGFGGKVSVPAGEGTSFSIAYSTFKANTMPEDTDAMFSDKGTPVTPYEGGSVKTTLIELGVSYDLGGGATLGAGIDKKSVESIMLETENGARVGTLSTADTTTLSASVAFSF